MEKIEKNVMDFLNHTSEEYGCMCADRFFDLMINDIYQKNINSPIEAIFYIALNFESQKDEMVINQFPDFDTKTKEFKYRDGIYVYPQTKIGKYVVDFLICYQICDEKRNLIVELDGHAFHDKNKTQRAYEKSRDRYLVGQGYKIFHYTGSELIADPNKVASEVIREVTKPANGHIASKSKGFLA